MSFILGPIQFLLLYSLKPFGVVFTVGINGQIVRFILDESVVVDPLPTNAPTMDVPSEVGDFGKIIELNTWWPQGMPFDDMSASVGDTIVFSWSEGFTHNVYISLDGTCDGAIEVSATDGGNMTDGNMTMMSTLIGDVSPVSYTIGADYAGETITFICTVEDHCVNGQIVNVNVGDYIEIDEWWPTGTRFNDTYAKAGDTVMFAWLPDNPVRI